MGRSAADAGGAVGAVVARGARAALVAGAFLAGAFFGAGGSAGGEAGVVSVAVAVAVAGAAAGPALVDPAPFDRTPGGAAVVPAMKLVTPSAVRHTSARRASTSLRSW